MKKSPAVLDAFRLWARTQFSRYSGAVAFVETEDAKGDKHIGSCFHVGDGVFVTARHVVDGMKVTTIGFDHDGVSDHLLSTTYPDKQTHGLVSMTDGPKFHADSQVDVACFKIAPYPEVYIPLGGHFDEYLTQYELVLYRTLVLGYPPIPLANKPALVASAGEVNALIEPYGGCRHPHFLVSTIARGGFSGGPALVAYNEDNSQGGTALLGLVTQSLVINNCAPELGYMAVLTVQPIYDCLQQHDMLPVFQELGLHDVNP